MHAHRFTFISFLGLATLTACSGAPGDAPAPGESVGHQAAALTGDPLPADANWAQGLSSDAISLGNDGDGTPLVPCRAAYNGSITPGKTRKDWGSCDIGYGGQELWLTNYQTLVPTWTATNYANIPGNALPFGYDVNKNPLFVCRAVINSGGVFSVQVGKTGNGIQGCDVPYGGSEMTVPAYQILTNTATFAVQALPMSAGAAIPAHAIPVGSDSNGATLYSCIAPYGGGMHPGKTMAGWGSCDISYGGGEYWVTDGWQILVPEMNGGPAAGAVRAFVGGSDTGGAPLGVCAASYAGGVHVGKYLSWGACNFGYGGTEVSLSSGYTVFSTYTDQSPITYNFSSITFPSGVALGGWATVTLNPDGSYVFSGHFHDSGSLAYNENTIVVVKGASGTAFTFSRSGSSAGTFESGSRDDDWNITGNNPAIRDAWNDLKNGQAVGAPAQQTSSVSLDFGSMWSALQNDIGYVEKIVAIVGPLFG